MTAWPFHNRSLARRGEILFAYDSLNFWLDIETHEINEKKEAESKADYTNKTKTINKSTIAL